MSHSLTQLLHSLCRVGCLGVGLMYPAYQTYLVAHPTAVQKKQQLQLQKHNNSNNAVFEDYKKWLSYWICYAIFYVLVEVVIEGSIGHAIEWFYEFKLIVLLYLLLPRFNVRTIYDIITVKIFY